MPEIRQNRRGTVLVTKNYRVVLDVFSPGGDTKITSAGE